MLQHALDERDAEIRRFKKGYDAHLFRKFLYRFIRIDQSLSELAQSSDVAQSDVVQLRRLFEDALDECGVERFEPRIGDDFRKVEGIGDNPKVRKAPTPEAAFRIAEVIDAGYRLRAGDGYEVIVPARVSVYAANTE